MQRCARASVRVQGEEIGSIGQGMVVLLGVGQEDGEQDAEYLCRKLPSLRIFRDESDKMNLDITQIGGEVLLISQFTLYGDARKGRRPDYTGAAPAEKADALYQRVLALLRAQGIPVQCGRFGADMQVELVNDGPVTILLDSHRQF